MLILCLRFVHVAAMALWFAAGVFATGDIRRSLAHPDELPGLRVRMAKTALFAIVGGVVTLVSGILLIFALGGFAAVPWPIHLALVLGVLQAGIGGGGIGRTWAQIEAELDAGGTPDSVQPLFRRIAIMGGIFHALWVVNLGLMVFRSVLA